MKDIFEVMAQRRSIRRFKPKTPDRELLLDLVRHAALAPNAMNRQDWHFTIVLSRDTQKEIARAVEDHWGRITQGDSGIHEAVKGYKGNFTAFHQAPALVAVTTRKAPSFLVHMLGREAEGVMGASASALLAVQNLILAAHARGLGACVYTGCNAAHGEILRIINMTKKRKLVCLIALGYPDETPNFPGRKPVEDIMSFI